jgi:predicted nucleotidyltransferase component of viral defense system
MLEDVLDKAGWQVCQKLSKSKLAGMFYMAGGTALALQLGHRKSDDLDFFHMAVRKRINFNIILDELENVFKVQAIKVVSKKADQTMIEVHGTKVTFLAYPFPLVEQLVDGKQVSGRLAGLKLASPQEIALMKAYTLGRRANYRDYLDLYFILSRELVGLEYILTKSMNKFVIDGETLFSPRLFLEQLVYTKDIEDKEAALATVIGKRIGSGQIEDFFRSQVQQVIGARFLSLEGGSSNDIT